MNDIILTVIIPFCLKDKTRINALEHVLSCIKNQDLRVHNTNIKNWEFIFVEQVVNIDSENCKQYTQGIADRHLLLEYDGEFNKSWCMNVGAREATGDWVVFVDADMLFGKEYLYFANLWRSRTPIKFFIGWETIIKLPGKSEPVARLIRNTVLTAGGVFWCRKDFYWELGGMNENYFGYGGEDNDFWVRANFIIGENKELNNVQHCPYPMVHIYHDDAIPSPERFYHLDRVIEYPEKMIEKLTQANLGYPSSPTKVFVDDLQLKKQSLANKEGRGII